jgi:heme-degrading monooxygenase HmoA
VTEVTPGTNPVADPGGELPLPGTVAIMVLEVADIIVTPGSAARFIDAYHSARDVLAGTEGCRSVRMTNGIESPERFVLLVEWDSVEAHLENFRETDRYGRWRGAIGPFFASPPRVEHFTDV